MKLKSVRVTNCYSFFLVINSALLVSLPLEQARTELIKYVHSRHSTLFCTCHTLCSYCMHVVCNVTYVLVEYSVGLNKKLNYVLLSLPAIYAL